MKRLVLNFAAVAFLFALSVPAFSQEEKEKKEKTEKEKKEIEQIIITKKNNNEKTVIEINGDKITVNGKPIEDLKDDDVKVRRNKIKTMEGFDGLAMHMNGVGQNFNWDNNGGVYNLLRDVDENRAMLGVVTEEAEGGVKVTEVTKESAAEKAGIKEGDIIKKIDETKIENPDGLSEAVKKHKPGDKVGVTVLRDKKEQKITAELGKWKGMGLFGYNSGDNFKVQVPEYNFRDMVTPRGQTLPRGQYNQNWAWSSGSPKLGLSVQDTDDGKGVKVIEVDEDSNAAKAGVKEDDIITHFNDKEVNSADEVAKLVRENKDKGSIQLKVKRGGKTQNIEVKMPKKLKTADL